jgi:hypothetical protein
MIMLLTQIPLFLIDNYFFTFLSVFKNNFFGFSLSNYSVTVALLCFFFVMIINAFSFIYETGQIYSSLSLELAVAAIQAYVFITLLSIT